MRFDIAGSKYEVRVQTRKVTYADIYKGGKLVASGDSICNPEDEFDRAAGENLALNRAFDAFFDVKDAEYRQKAEALPIVKPLLDVALDTLVTIMSQQYDRLIKKLDKRRKRAEVKPYVQNDVQTVVQQLIANVLSASARVR